MTEPSQYFKGRTVQEQMDEVIGYVDTRAAEVATTAIASDVAQVHQDMLDADADAQAAAASAAAAAGTLANAVKKTGEASQSIAGNIAVSGTLSGGVVTGTQVTVPTPVNNTDAATKKYVDNADALKMNIADINSYAVGLTGNQGPIAGTKKFSNNLEEVTSIPGGSPPGNYTTNYGRFRVVGTDALPIIGMGFEKATTNNVRLVLNMNANTDPDTGNQPMCQIHFVMDEVNGSLNMVPAHIDKNGIRTFGTPISLMTWTP